MALQYRAPDVIPKHSCKGTVVTELRQLTAGSQSSPVQQAPCMLVCVLAPW